MNTSLWNIDPSHSTIAFSIRHMMFAKVRGHFASWRGSVEMDPEALEKAAVRVSIDANSIDTGTEKRDEHLRSEDFLDVAKFPELKFRSTKIIKRDDESYELHGKLTVRETTKELVLETSFAGRGKDPWGVERAGFSASATILRSDFGLTWNQALETGGVLVGDKIELELDLQLVKAAAANAA